MFFGLVLLLWNVAGMFSNPVWAGPLDLKPTIPGTERYGETFTLIADLSDGSYLQIQLGFSNLGTGDGRGACRLLLSGPLAPKPINGSVNVGKDWEQSAKPIPALNLGPCSAVLGPRPMFVAEVDGYEAMVQLVRPLGFTVPPYGRMRKGKDTFALTILEPWGRGNIEIRKNGKKIHTGKAAVYVDHYRSTMAPWDIASHRIRFRGLHHKTPWLLWAKQPKEGQPWVGWAFRRGDRAPKPLQKINIQHRGPKDSRKAFGVWQIEAKDSQGRTIRIETRGRLYRYAPVEEYGAFSFLLKAVAGNPITQTFRSHFWAQASRQPNSSPETIPAFTELPTGLTSPSRALLEVSDANR